MAADEAEEAFAYLETIAVPQLLDTLIEIGATATKMRFTRVAEAAHEITISFLRELNETAVKMAGTADGLIIRKIFESRNAKRPLTGNLEAHIRSVPGPLGSVRVALLSELDKIVNPQGGYGAFWKAQEFGTGEDTGDDRFDPVPSQEGRVIRGTFSPSGEPPDASQRGLGVGRDLAFVPGGTSPGWGTISEELPGRHFLRDGVLEAGERYFQILDALRDGLDKRIKALGPMIEEEVKRSGGDFLGVIEA